MYCYHVNLYRYARHQKYLKDSRCTNGHVWPGRACTCVSVAFIRKETVGLVEAVLKPVDSSDFGLVQGLFWGWFKFQVFTEN